ncbi:hypothetical protein A4X09_0g7271, partial [Tilletia walkeri]
LSPASIARSGASSRQGSHVIPAQIVYPHRHRDLASARDLNTHGDHHHRSYLGTPSSASSAQPQHGLEHFRPSAFPCHASLVHHVLEPCDPIMQSNILSHRSASICHLSCCCCLTSSLRLSRH